MINSCTLERLGETEMGHLSRAMCGVFPLMQHATRKLLAHCLFQYLKYSLYKLVNKHIFGLPFSLISTFFLLVNLRFYSKLKVVSPVSQ